MESKLKRLTIRQIAKAMIEDTTRQARGVFVRKRSYKGEKQFYSCAIGGAALKLGVDEGQLYMKLSEIGIDGIKPLSTTGYWTRIGSWIVHENDDGRAAKAAIGEQILRTADKDTLNAAFFVPEKEWRL